MRWTSFPAVILFSVTSIFAGVNRWTTAGPGIGRVTQVASDVTTGSSVYAQTSSGIYRSDDGTTWRAVNDGLPSPGDIRAFAVTPVGLFASIESTVFMSIDGGEHWQRRGNAGSVSIAILAFDPHNQTLLAGTTGGVFYSVDAGRTWIVGATPSSVGGVLALVVSSNAAMVLGANGYGLMASFRSIDGGKTWQNASTVPYSVYADPSNDAIYGTVGQTVYVSLDQGATFNKIQSVPVSGAAALVSAGPMVYAVTSSGVYASYQTTKRWSMVGSSMDVHSLAVLQNPTRLFAANARGVVAMQPGGRDWIAVNEGLPRNLASDVAAADPDPARAFAATDNGVFRSEDSGATWSTMNVGARNLAFSPNSADVAYATGLTFMKSTDAGVTWNGIAMNVSRLAIAPSDPSTLYANFVDRLTKSTNGGKTWATVMNGIPPDLNEYYGYAYGPQASSIAVDPSNASTAYVALSNGLYQTADGGEHWSALAAQSYLGSLTIDPRDSALLFATSWSRGVLKSQDAGRTWTSAGLIDKKIITLAGDGSRLFAGSDDGHVYRSDNGGDSWRGLDEGLGRGTVNRIAAKGDLVYAATAGGVYEYQFVETTIHPEQLAQSSVRLPQDTETGFVLPVTGKAVGGGGTTYTTDVTLTNAGAVAQKLLVTWLPGAGGGDSPASFSLTIPSGVTNITDVSAMFGISGMGSLAFVPLDDAGEADGNASIAASTRIWTHPAGGRAPIAQTIAAARGDALSDHTQVGLGGLRSDSEFRSNAGIVNLSSEMRQFTIQISGTQASDQITIAVPAFSLVQVSLPDRDFGDVLLLASSDVAAKWLLYGSVIDRATGESQTSLSKPLPPPTPTEEVWIRGSVIDGTTRLCINHATIEVVGDPRPSSHTTNECGQPFDENFLITGMAQGATVLLRVAADGYRTKDFPNVILGDIDDQMFIMFSLDKQ